jgi:hypothetical protein
MKLRHGVASLLFPLLVVLSSPLARAQQNVLRAGADLPSPPAPGSSSAELAAAIMPVVAPRPVSLQRRSLTLYDWSLLAAAGTLRFFDYKTTEKCLSDPADFHEVELPTSLVSNKPAFAAFESSTVVANYFAYRLVARRHRTLARLGQYINIGSIGSAVGGNYVAIAQHFPHSLNASRPRPIGP